MNDALSKKTDTIVFKPLDYSVKCFDIGKGFCFDVVTTLNSYDVYLYHNEYGIKELLFGVGKNHSFDDVLEMVKAQVLDGACLDFYRINYMD